MTIERLERDLDEKRVELGVATVELDKISGSLKGVTAKYQTELDARQNELLPFQEELRMVQAELDVSRSALDMVESKGKVDAKEIAVLNTRRDRVRDEISEAERKKTILGKQRLALKAKIDQETESTKGLEAERKNRAKQLQLLQSTTAEAMAALQQGDSGSAVCKAVIKESRAGRIRGIHGRLGDLGAIDAKYDVAIATACGYLDHIVVENTEVGQKCIEFLRKNNIGRASFIVLDKMKPANRSPPADLPEGAIRLFDLVKLKDDRFINAMYFALTDTLVARNLEEAQRWAYGKRRWRVITLDGKLFEVSGTVSGGGQVRRGGMGAQIKEDGVTQEQVQLLQDQCRETQEELKQIANALAKGQLSLVECEEQLMRTEAELSLIEGLLRSLPAELEMIETNIASINQKSSIGLSVEDEKEIKKLNQQISAGEVKLSKIRSIMSPIEAALVEIQQKILDAGGIKFKVQRSKVEGLTEQVDNVERRLGELSKEKVTLEKRLMALKEGKRDEGAIEKVNVELAELDKKLKDATSKAINLHQEFNQLQKTLDERNDQVEELKASLETISKSVIKFRKVEYEFRCAIEADETRMVELEKMTVAYSAELQQLHLHHIDTSKPAPVLPIYEDERDLGEFVKNLSQIKQTIDGLVVRLERSLPNLKVLEEYREKEATLHEQQAELQTIEGQRDEVRAKYDDLCRKRLDEFMVGFRTISQRLKELYQLITMGGNAELELVDSLDPFSEGVLFSVMPPRKSWKNISNLSGGEKTLSSLALVFALHIYRPTPIYIMDEIDAALDFRNVSIVAHYIKERTKDAQFIVISLRNNMFELADRLVGIYKTWQRTKCVVLDPRQFHLPPITTE